MRAVRWIAVMLLLGALGAGSHAEATPATRPPTRSVDPAMVAAETAWRTAEATRDPTEAEAAWRAAAIAFTAAGDATAGADRGEARYAAVLAWRNAMNVAPARPAPPARPSAPPPPPSPTLSPDETALVAAIDAYLPLARADEIAGLQFTRGMVFRRHARHAEVVPQMAAIVAEHPDDEVAEYAANVLLDALNQQAKYEELLAWVGRMRADRRLLAHRPELVRTVEALHVQGQRKQAETAQAAGDVAGYARCAAIYRQVLVDVPRAERADELLYNGGVCAEASGAVDDARTRYRALLKRYPRSALAAATRARVKALRGGR